MFICLYSYITDLIYKSQQKMNLGETRGRFTCPLRDRRNVPVYPKNNCNQKRITT